jgi:hypothetical protein
VPPPARHLPRRPGHPHPAITTSTTLSPPGTCPARPGRPPLRAVRAGKWPRSRGGGPNCPTGCGICQRRLFRVGCRFSLGSRVPVWGAWATGPVYRGMCATAPERPAPPRGACGPPAPSTEGCVPQAPDDRTCRPCPQRRSHRGRGPRSPDGVLSWPDRRGFSQDGSCHHDAALMRFRSRPAREADRTRMRSRT